MSNPPQPIPVVQQPPVQQIPATPQTQAHPSAQGGASGSSHMQGPFQMQNAQSARPTTGQQPKLHGILPLPPTLMMKLNNRVINVTKRENMRNPAQPIPIFQQPPVQQVQASSQNSENEDIVHLTNFFTVN
ncbi:uncharacterized protein LOC117282741 [Cryptotermes secundus]|uniref:uncharacterized protein LOC117282741 n=1 Tax=Cryptotermes secundus TaxID=105785 RepID=UPI001454CED2|nr:uncharacterized protein LOC117282741 [Cryptotermes secundus]